MSRGPSVLEIINNPGKGRGSNEGEDNAMCVYSSVYMGVHGSSCVYMCVWCMNVPVYMQVYVYTFECMHM